LDIITLNLRHIKAGNGGDGSGDRSTGADGDDKFIEVPLGTVVKIKPEKYYLNYRRW
jgi:GTPase involved in cell partitioning and DNA repair